MQNITTVADLKTAIQGLEYKQAHELSLLKEQVLITTESLQPLNLLKSSFKNIISSPGLKDTLLDTSIGLTAGYLSKALIIGASHNPIKKILGAVFQLGVSNVATNNSDTIKLLAGKVANFFGKKKNEREAGNILRK